MTLPSATPLPMVRETRLLSRERGAAAVEFALIVPILLILVFGIIEFSVAYNRQQGLHAAAREGARLASIPTTTLQDIQDRIDDTLSGVIGDQTPTITITPNTATPCASGDSVQVTVSVPTTIEIPFITLGSMTQTGHGDFKCET